MNWITKAQSGTRVSGNYGARAKTDYSGRPVLESSVDSDRGDRVVTTTFDGNNTNGTEPYRVRKLYYPSGETYLNEIGTNNGVRQEVDLYNYYKEGVPQHRADTTYNGLEKGDPGYEELQQLYRTAVTPEPTAYGFEPNPNINWKNWVPLKNQSTMGLQKALLNAPRLQSNKKGGSINWIERHQGGGVASQLSNPQMEELLNTLAAAMVLLQLLSAAAEQGDKQATAIMGEVQKRAQAMAGQNGPAMAKCGAKLKKKAAKCACGCKPKMACGGKSVPEEKCGGKAKAKKCACGSNVPSAKCGCKAKKSKKCEGGAEMPMAKCGKKVKKSACGKKLACGSSITKKAITGCKACKKHIMRLGGRIITVDCFNNILN